MFERGMVVIATWGRPEHCEAAAYLDAVDSLLPAGSPGPFASSEPGAPQELASRAGLAPGEPREVPCAWSFPNEETLLRALTSTASAVDAIAAAGLTAVTEKVLQAVAPYRTIDGGYRIENVFTYVIAHAQHP
jgi:hypothetical protein